MSLRKISNQDVSDYLKELKRQLKDMGHVGLKFEVKAYKY